MTIERDGKLYTLTEQEVHDAYNEQRIKNDLAYIQEYIDNQDDFPMLKDDRCAKEVAKVYRRWLDEYLENSEGDSLHVIAFDIFVDAYNRIVEYFI